MKKPVILIICIFVYLSCTQKSSAQSLTSDPLPELIETRYFPNHREWLRLSDEEKLNIIFSEYYDIEIVKHLLGAYLENFLETFQSTEVRAIAGNILIEGFMPAGNRFTNGIIKIEGNNIFILFGHFENSKGMYLFFTNSLSILLPMEFYGWRLFPELGDIEIRRMQ